MEQLSLIDTLCDVYEESVKPISNNELYSRVGDKLGIVTSEDQFKEPVGKSGQVRNLFHRKIRWAQQSLKQKKIVKRVSKGAWELTENHRIKLRSIKAGQCALAYSTEHGLCLWSRSDSVFKSMLDEPVHLLLTSPPYPLKVARAYGNPAIVDYLDFICTAIEPIIEKLAPGGSIALNLGNDIFHELSPARSTYIERLIIALEDRFGLFKMDVLPWVSNKIPGPVQWASKQRMQLNTGYEPVLWLCNDPNKCLADNRRVLQPHSESHKRLMSSGGLANRAVNGDGAYRKKQGAFGKTTTGKIPRNVLEFSNYCTSGRQVNQYAKELGLPPHSAKMPFSLAQFLINFLTQPGQLVVDPFAGTMTTGEAAEFLGRRWLCVEMIWEYIRQSFVRFKSAKNMFINPELLNL